jgi:hypothetical protein
MGAGRLALAVGAGTAVAAAVAFDVLADEHPTHTVSLGIVAAVVAAVAACVRFTEVLDRALSRPVRLLAVGPSVGAAAVRGERRGSMLRWCGWTVRAGRRGPPAPAW